MKNIAETLLIKASCIILLAMFAIIHKEGNKVFLIL